MFGSRTASPSTVSGFCVLWPAIVMSLLAVVPSTVVWSACACPRTVASIVSSIGFHSGVYLTCTRRATTSKGAASRHAAFIERFDRGRIVVSGRDRATYLQGLLTNDITALKPGEGCYTAYLTPQGRMIADLFVYELGDLMLLTMPLELKDVVLAKLDQFIFTEDVQLGDVTATFAEISIVGPDAAGVLAGILDLGSRDALAALPEHGNVRGQIGGQSVIVTRVADTGEAGFGVYVEGPQAEALESKLRSAGTSELDAETADAIRIQAGVPKVLRDMDEETIPLEAGIESRAISMTKGCYVGQEVIIRVLHRGHGRVAKRLVGIVLDGESVPTRGAAVRADGRDVGRVTSSVLSPALKRPIALAYLQRDFVAPGTAVSVEGSRAAVTEVPFVRGQV